VECSSRLARTARGHYYWVNWQTCLPFASKPKGVFQISQQLNIVGKRSGEGFVAHKAQLAVALSRCLADRITLMDFTIGRKGFLNYIKALGGSNIVKIVPSTEKGKLKVVCGANTSQLDEGAWIKEKTPMVFAEVRVSPSNKVNPNLSSLELAEALMRVLPFTSDEENQPVYQNVLFKASDGKLSLVATDGVRLAIQQLDFVDGIDEQVLVHKDELKGVANALKRSRRVNVSFEPSGENLEGKALVIDTEAIRYKFVGSQGTFPNYEQFIPTDLNVMAHFDAIEATKAVATLKAIANDPKDYAIDLKIANGFVEMADPDANGNSLLPADTEGEGTIRIDGKYFADTMRACNGMVDLALINAYSPMMFSTDGYTAIVMPMMTNESKRQKEDDRKAKQAEADQQPTDQAEATEPEAEAKQKRSRKKEPEPVKA
jgi:DNA polymerase-3 subunit beta